MSDIARWAAFDGGIAPHPCGKWILCDDHQAEIGRLTAERDEARAEVRRLIAQRDAAQAEVERLRANPSASLTRSRPTDEDIWREAFMSAVHDVHKNWMDVADVALAQYRKRWPR